MRVEEQKPSFLGSRRSMVLLSLGFLSSSYGFLHPSSLASPLHTSLSAVQVDPLKTRRRRLLSEEEESAAASRLNELLRQTPQDQNVLKEIAGHIEILCEADEDVNNNNPPEESPAEEEQTETESKSSESASEDTMEERRKMAARAALLGSRISKGKPQSAVDRANSRTSTSVGSIRVGSATKARQGPGVTKRIMDAVRKSATTNKPIDDNDNPQNPKSNPSASMAATAPGAINRKLTPSGIHSAVMDLMDRKKIKADGPLDWNEPPQLLQPPCEQLFCKTPPPGTVLIPAAPDFVNKVERKLQFPDCVTIRVAHGLQAQDTEVAHLRLSVFSDFSPEVRRQLVSRSVNAVVTRRMKGATCLIATVPPSISARKRNRPPVILGSAECSFHEFDGTTLGQRRPEKSILYITEVAVNPNARRRGIGRKLLEAVDILGKVRGIETLYLHVDVENESAITLYEKAGYQKVNSSEPMFLEFTTKLNLHDGATKGRNHYLLYKDMVANPTWLPPEPNVQEVPQSKVRPPGFYEPAMGTLGIQVPG